MKKLITFLSCFFAAMMMYWANASGVSDFSRETDSPGFFKEGRTYWYEYRYAFGGADTRFGIRIGEKTVIDGKEWYGLDLVDRLNKNIDTQEVIEYTKDPIRVAYVREEGGNIYRTVANTAFETNTLKMPWSGLVYGSYSDDTYTTPDEPIYGYGQVGFQTKVDWLLAYQSRCDATVTNVEQIENSGRTYNIYTLKFKPQPEYSNEEWEIAVIESIGAFGPYTGGFGFPKPTRDGEMLFHPFSPAMSGIDYNPKLLYVTEGEDNNIIFEREAGLKLWEYQPGTGDVETVEVESNEAAQWFNLQGVEIPAPSASGIYIRKTGSKVEKVQL